MAEFKNRNRKHRKPYGIQRELAYEEVQNLRKKGERARLIETNRNHRLYAAYEGVSPGESEPEKITNKSENPMAGTPSVPFKKRVPKETIELYDEGEKPYIAEIIGPDKNYHYERKFISDMRTHEGGSKRHPIYKVHFKGELPYGTIVETQDRAYMVVPRSNRFPHGLRGIGTEGMPNRLKMNKLFEARNRAGYHKKIKPEEEKKPNFLFYR